MVGTSDAYRENRKRSHDEAWMRNNRVRTSESLGTGSERRSGILQETSPHWSDPGGFDYIYRNATRLAEAPTNYGRGTYFMGVPKHGSISHDQFEPDGGGDDGGGDSGSGDGGGSD